MSRIFSRFAKSVIPSLAFVFSQSALPLQAYAGSVVGNGGDAILCQKTNGLGESIELLDLYEHRILSGRNPRLSGRTMNEVLNELIGRVQQFDGSLANDLRTTSNRFFSTWRFVEPGSLPEIHDATPRVRLDGCRSQQLVVHTLPQPGGGTEFLVDRGLWQRLNEWNRAAAVFHELIYAIARRDAGQMRSDGVRAFVGQVFERAPAMPTDMKMYLTLLRGLPRRSAGIPLEHDARLGFLNIDLSAERDLSFHPNGALRSAKVLHEYPLTVRFKNLMPHSQLRVNGVVEFDNRGLVSAVNNQREVVLNIDSCDVRVAASNCKAATGDCRVIFDSARNIKSLVLADSIRCRTERRREIIGQEGERLFFPLL